MRGRARFANIPAKSLDVGETEREKENETEKRSPGFRLGFVNDYHVALIIASEPQFSPPSVAMRVFLAEPSLRKSPSAEGIFLSVVSEERGEGGGRGKISSLRQFPKSTFAITQPNEMGEAVVTQVAFRCLTGDSFTNPSTRRIEQVHRDRLAEPTRGMLL